MPPAFQLHAGGRCALGFRQFAKLAVLTVMAGAQIGAGSVTIGRWAFPFQAGQPSPKKLHPVASRNCNRALGKKCASSALVDYDHDGTVDRAEMVEGTGVSAIVVWFGAIVRRPPLTVASFKGSWPVDCYIESMPPRRIGITLICPETSSAVFEMRGGKPAARWLAD